MSKGLSRTSTRVAVLEHLLRRSGGGGVFGTEIMDSTGLRSGTVYPILARLEEMGWVVSSWEDQAVAAAQKRPARRYYRLTGLGEASAREYCAPREPLRIRRNSTA
jgi:PadR family transcriptional regulator, regulatory protein PadR